VRIIGGAMVIAVQLQSPDSPRRIIVAGGFGLPGSLIEAVH
jgi:hypothetical protein